MGGSHYQIHGAIPRVSLGCDFEKLFGLGSYWYNNNVGYWTQCNIEGGTSTSYPNVGYSFPGRSVVTYVMEYNIASGPAGLMLSESKFTEDNTPTLTSNDPRS